MLGRTSVRAVGAALLLLAVAVMPATAGNGPNDLSSPSVSPTSGTTATAITFSVTYHSSKNQAPDYVRVVVGSKTFSLENTAGTESWKNGVRYSVTTKLPAGTWTVRFEAASAGFHLELAGDTVTITPAPSPTPKPEPTPKPTPKPEPTPKPTPKPEPTPQPTPVATPTPTPSSAPEVGRWLAPQVDPVDWPLEVPAADAPSSSPQPSPSQDPSTAVVVPGAGSSSGGSGGGSGGAGGNGGGGSDGSLPGGISGPATAVQAVARALPTVVVTTGGVTMLMAFMVFGRRRRDSEPTGSDEELSQAAGRGFGMPGHSGLVPEPAVASARVQAVIAAAGPAETDAHLPRWRRPSLMEARKADPLRSVSTPVRLTFDGEVGEAVSGMERRLIRYRLVSLLDVPDEVRGVEIDVLDEGDEVVLLEKRGTYWRVLCPDGRSGWLHKMTLGDVVIESNVSSPGSWTSGDEGPQVGGFEDVLRAYMDRRTQFGEA